MCIDRINFNGNKGRRDLFKILYRTFIIIIATALCYTLICPAPAKAAPGTRRNVYYVTYSAELPPSPVLPGDSATIPTPDPTRANYTFNCWTTTPGGDGPAYDFNTPVYEDLVLYASWTAVPNSATYKVKWWLEVPDLDVPPVPGTGAHYALAAEETRTGTPGSYVYIDKLPYLEYDWDGIYVDYENPLYYAEFQSCAATEISGANNTIVNVYLTRKVYRIVFDLGADDRWLEMKGSGIRYYGSEYYIDYKFEQDITDIWPGPMTAIFSVNTQNGLPFKGWLNTRAANLLVFPSTDIYVTRMVVAGSEMMPKYDYADEYSLVAEYGAPYHENVFVRYWFEELPGQSGAYRTYTVDEVTRNYFIDRRYDEDYPPEDIVPKPIYGMLLTGSDTSNNETGTGYSESEAETYINFYYTRNQHNLYFDMNDSLGLVISMYGLMYDEPLDVYYPTDPARALNEFKGWYKDSDCTLEFDFYSERMPADNDLIVYAKMEYMYHAVSFFEGTTHLGEQSVADAAVVNFNNLRFNGTNYDTKLSQPGKGDFIGWLYYPFGADVLSPFPADLPVYSNMELYVNWTQVEYNVINNTGGVTPTPKPTHTPAPTPTPMSTPVPTPSSTPAPLPSSSPGGGGVNGVGDGTVSGGGGSSGAGGVVGGGSGAGGGGGGGAGGGGGGFNDLAPASTPTPTPTPTPKPIATPIKTPSPDKTPKPEAELLEFGVITIDDEENPDMTVGIKLQWNIIAGVDSYDIYRAEQGNAFTLIATGVAGDLFVDLELEPETEYNYIICPEGKDIDDVDASDVVAVTTGPVAAPLLQDSEGDYGPPNGYIMMRIDEPMMNVNGEDAEVDPGRGTTPMLVKDRTVLPIRAIVEAMGGVANWDEVESKVTLSANGNRVIMWIGQYAYSVNGMNAAMDIEPFLENDRTFLPLRFVAESLNCRVTWINATMEILIVYRRID